MKNIALLFFTIILSVACSDNTSQAKSDEFLVLVPSAFNERLSHEESAQLIDVRTTAEFEKGTIPEAKNYNILDGTFQANLSSLDKSKTVFVFCAKGGRSGKAAALLREKGFKSIIDLQGGYTSWSKQ